MQKFLMTRKTKERLGEEIERFEKEVERLKLEIGEAYRSAPGDGWHDNAALEAVDESLKMTEIYLRDVKLRARLARLIEPNKETRVVAIGNGIRVGFEEGREEIWTILGEDDSSTQNGWISHTSLVGQAIMGKKVGQEVDLGWDKVKVLEIIPGDFE